MVSFPTFLLSPSIGRGKFAPPNLSFVTECQLHSSRVQCEVAAGTDSPNSSPSPPQARSSALASASAALQDLLREDRLGEPSLLLARGIVQYAQSVRFRVAPGLVTVLQAVNVREVATASEAARRLSFKERQKRLSRKERKQDKQQAKIRRQVEQTRASQSREARLQLVRGREGSKRPFELQEIL